MIAQPSFSDEVKNSARGREVDILVSVAGIPVEKLDGQGYPCPACNGDDRFALIDQERGAVICRKCFASQNGDYLAAVMHFRKVSFPEAIQLVADFLGVSNSMKNSIEQNGKLTGSTKASPLKKKTPNLGEPTAVYDYRDEAGVLLFQVCRYELLDSEGKKEKTFRQRRPDGNGGWSWKVKGIRQVLYRLPELIELAASEPLFIVEGEKDVDNLVAAGIEATCNACGAEKWNPVSAIQLKGRNIVILPDNDETGARHAQIVAASLHGVAESVKVLQLPDLSDKGDVSDWLNAGGSAEMLHQLSSQTVEWEPTTEPWLPIDPFIQANLPTFPVEVLPTVLQDWVSAESIATQTPPDLAGLLSLAVCAAAIARKVEIMPRQGWKEPTNLFVAVILEPGNRKSAVFSDSVKPLREVETDLIVEARPNVAREKSRRRQDEAKLKKLEKIAAEKGDDQARHEAQELAAELIESNEPELPRLLVDDATSEQLGRMLESQGGRLASMSPEGGVFDLMAGMYSNSGMPQFGVYLQSHSGDDLRTDRVTRESVIVERPALTCAYTIQPQVIAGLSEKSAFRGRGLLARFLYALPMSWIGSRKIAPPSVPEQVADAYRKQVKELCLLEEETTLEFSSSAENRLREWESEVECMLSDGSDMETIRDWGGKLAGATVRIAGILHCVEHGPVGQIGKRTLEAAMKIVRYLIPHAETVLILMHATSNTAFDDASYIIRWIINHEKLTFSKRDLHQHGKRRFSKADDIDPALDELCKRNYIRKLDTESSGRGRPSSPRFESNPIIFDKSPEAVHSQYPQKSESFIENEISEISEDIHRDTENRIRIEL